MERYNRYVDLPEIEAKKIFLQVIDYEFNLMNYFSNGSFNPPQGITENEYFERLYKEYLNLFLDRAKRIEKRQK